MRDVVETLDAMGLLEYGSVIDGDMLREMACIEYPEIGTREEFASAQLEELAIVDRIRTALLAEGKYIKSHRNDYRILTPSENASQVESYMRSADHKLKRAITLSSNTPKIEDGPKCNRMARALIKRESIQRRLVRLAA